MLFYKQKSKWLKLHITLRNRAVTTKVHKVSPKRTDNNVALQNELLYCNTYIFGIIRSFIECMLINNNVYLFETTQHVGKTFVTVTGASSTSD